MYFEYFRTLSQGERYHLEVKPNGEKQGGGMLGGNSEFFFEALFFKEADRKSVV